MVQAQGRGLVSYLTTGVQHTLAAWVVWCHHILPIVLQAFTVFLTHTSDSKLSCRPPINKDFMVGGTPGKGQDRYCCPCCEAHWAAA